MTIYFQSPVLFVDDIEATRHFYETLLGQRMHFDTGLNIGFIGGFAFCQSDHTHRRIFAMQQPQTGPVTLHLQTHDLDIIREKLRLVGINTHLPYTESPERTLTINDLDGNFIELQEINQTATTA